MEINQISISVNYLISGEILQTTVLFQDRFEEFYYSWTLFDTSGKIIASKSIAVSKRLIEKNPIEYLVNHVKFSINNFKINRKKVFEVIETVIIH